MRVPEKFDYRDLVLVPQSFSGLEIVDAGTGEIRLSNEVLFFSANFLLNTQADGLGIDITGFDFVQKNTRMTTQWGLDVYEGIQITDVTYQTGTIYAFGDIAGSIVGAFDPNRLQSQIDEIITGSQGSGLDKHEFYGGWKDRTSSGLFEYGHTPISKVNYPAGYTEVGDKYEQANLDIGNPASGVNDFYPSPPEGYFIRIGVKDSDDINSTDDVDDSLELITLTTEMYNRLKRSKSPAPTGADGVPVRCKLVSGLLPTGLSIGTTYFIRFKTTPDIELYDTEANAIDTSGTTGRIDLTDAVGVFKLTQEGITLDDTLQEHSHTYGRNSATAASSLGLASAVNASEVGTAIKGMQAQDSNGIPRGSNETKGREAFLFGYVKIENVTASGETVSALRDSTGWLLNELGGVGVADWTQVQLGDDPTNPASVVNHGLAANISDLLIDLYISTDGTDNNSFKITVSSSGVTNAGFGLYQIDGNSFELQTLVNGIVYTLQDGSAIAPLTTQNWYYKIVTIKPNLVATYADTTFRKVFTINDANDITVSLPDASTTITERTYKRRGSGTGKILFTTQSAQTIDGLAPTQFELRGETEITLFPDSGNWEQKQVIMDWVLFDVRASSASFVKAAIDGIYRTVSTPDNLLNFYDVIDIDTANYPSITTFKSQRDGAFAINYTVGTTTWSTVGGSGITRIYKWQDRVKLAGL